MQEVVVVSSPELAREILQTHDKHFANRFPLEATRQLFYNHAASLSMNYGPRWQQLRRAYATNLLSPSRIASLRHVPTQEIAPFLAALEGYVQQATVTNEPGTAQQLPPHLDHQLPFHLDANHNPSVRLNQLVFNITAGVMSCLLLGNDIDSAPAEGSLRAGGLQLRDMVTQLSRLFSAPVIGDFVPLLRWLDLGGFKAQMKALHLRLDAFLDAAIQQRLRGEPTLPEGPADFLEVLLLINRHNMQEVKASFLEMLTGGMETTSATIEWTMVELIRHPHTLKKMQEELEMVVGMKHMVEEPHLSRLPFTQAVIQETLRLHPAIPMLLHRARGDSTCEVAGYEIAPNTLVFVNVWGMGRDPLIWERAEEFWPERFLQNKNQNLSQVNMKGQHFGLLPFGSGRRICPGMQLGLLMVTLITANLVHSFNWTLSPSSLPYYKDVPQEQLINALDLTERFGVIAAIANSLIIVPRLRT